MCLAQGNKNKKKKKKGQRIKNKQRGLKRKLENKEV